MSFVLIVAGGRGHRIGGPIPKQYRTLGGIPIIRHTIEAFRGHEAITGIQVVIHPADHELYQNACGDLDLPPPVHGGASRQDSVRRGLEALIARSPATILIHDAVRPFVTPATIMSVIAALTRSPGAIAGVPLADTLKRCRDGKIVETVERTDLWRAQTPQGFRFADILAAHRQALRAGIEDLTDDAAVAAHAGLAVEMVPASDDNFKITTEDDLIRAESRRLCPRTPAKGYSA